MSHILLSRMAMKGFDENKNNALDTDERTQFIYYLKVRDGWIHHRDGWTHQITISDLEIFRML